MAIVFRDDYQVAEEIEKHVSHINEHRKKAGMEEYRPKQPEVGVRKLRKIEDFRRGVIR